MYVEHFKLKKRPFVDSCDTESFLPTMESDEAVAHIQQVLLARDGGAVITGGPGVGKSAIIEEARKAVKDKVAIAYVDLRHMEPELLYQMVLLGLGAEIGDGNIVDSLSRIRTAIRKYNKDGRKVTAVIDINGFTAARANHILRLTHLAAEPGGQLNIILSGPHTLHKLLDIPGLIHIRQRIGFRYRVRPFTVAETEAYIQNQLTAAKGKAEDILADGVSMTVYRYVGGVPRLINTLMDAALSEACVQKLNTLSVDLIHGVAKTLGWKALSRGQPAAPKAALTLTPKTTKAKAAEKPAEKAPEKPAANTAEKSEPASAAEKKAAKGKKTKAKDDAKPAKKDDKKSAAKPDEDDHPDHVKTGQIFEQPVAILAETEENCHEGLSVSDLTPEGRSGEKQEPGELTQRLLVAAGDFDLDPNQDADAPEPEPVPEEIEEEEALFGGVPEMDEKDTSATGMLRLEDLEARFAETIFGDDDGMASALEELSKTKVD